ncbi:hypothetical protein MN116_003608 [Schistosoma mekongi]|uniref:Uncharacterized protein n=1 Tax=Schistosoma mekongi TaxID=38744 RepID=A0AAE2D5W8_SCHME|nr:hypothetical protein MN116_003608 [Schistosoma mekongi]
MDFQTVYESRRTLSVELCSEQKRPEFCQHNLVNDEDSRNDKNETINIEISGKTREDISDTFTRKSILSTNRSLPSYQSKDIDVLHQIDFQQTESPSSITVVPQHTFSETTLNTQQKSLVYNKGSLIFDSSNHLKYSISPCPIEHQTQLHSKHKTLYRSNLDSLRKPKNNPAAGKNSSVNKKLIKTRTKLPQNLLINAAEGLRELSRDSSDDEHFDSNSSLNFLTHTSTQNLNDSSSSTESSKHTYTMESPTEFLDRKLELEQMDRSYHSAVSNNSESNSVGSHIHESTDYTTSNGAFTRPRLPHTVVPNGEFRLRVDKNTKVGTNKENKSSYLPLKVTDLLSFEELDDYLFDTQKLVTQLEQKMANNKSEIVTSQKQWSVKQNEAISSTEDYEVARALNNADQLLGSTANKRLSAILRRRQDKQRACHSDVEQAKRVLNGSSGITEGKSTRSRKTTQSSITSRPQSQQPTSRCVGNSHVSSCDQSFVPVRNASETRRNYSNRLSHNSSNFSTSVEKSTKSFFSQKVVNIDHHSISNNHSSTSSTPESSRQLGSNAIKTSKMLAALNWQRRKSYDPRQFLNKSTGNSTARSQSRPPKDDDILSISTDSKSKSCLTNRSVNPTRRLTVTTRRTAPVDTTDCIAAMEIVRQINHNNDVQSMGDYYDRTTIHTVKDSNRKGFTSQHNQEFKETDPKIITSDKKFDTCESRLKTKQTSRTSSVCDGTKHCSRHQNSNGNKNANKHFPSVVTARLPTHQQIHASNSQSCTNESNFHCPSGSSKIITIESTGRNKTSNQNEMNYQDIAVETVKFKIEKLTNFIVRLRKRIERDYAEHGTCSPGDDVFGDEAVGAVVAGRSTGMHPVVASCLQNLRVLEVNAQEIFNLLYPNEIDFWEPARVCLLEGKDDEKLFNDARSQITEQLSSSIETSGKTLENTSIVQSKILSPLDNCSSDSPHINKELDTLSDADLI